MKKMFTYLFLISSVLSCNAQNTVNTQIDFLKFIDSDNVRTKIIKQQINSKEYEIICPYYELNKNEIHIGSACLFAVTKIFPERWVNETKKSECANKPSYYGSLLCQAKRLFFSDTLLLKKELDIYVFFIDNEELEGPFREEVQGGVYENYTPIKGSTITIYKFEGNSNQWKIIDNQINNNGVNPRVFGEFYVKRIALERINDYLIKINLTE
jgi:hypothetical protein